MNNNSFKTTLFRIPGKGGWTFVTVPDSFAPPVNHAWGRTPVLAKMDGKEWATSVWRDKSGKTLLPVPVKIRGVKEAGDDAEISIKPR